MKKLLIIALAAAFTASAFAQMVSGMDPRPVQPEITLDLMPFENPDPTRGGVPVPDVAPTQWGNYFRAVVSNSPTGGGTFSKDLTAGYVNYNYLLAYRSPGDAFSFENRMLYLFDVSTLDPNYTYAMTGITLLQNSSGANQTMRFFDAGDLGLEIANPLPGDGSNVAAGLANATPFASFSIPANEFLIMNVDVASQVQSDLGGSYTGFLIDVPSASAGNVNITRFWNVGLNRSGFAVPTLGEVGLFVFVALLGISAMVIARRKRLGASA